MLSPKPVVICEENQEIAVKWHTHHICKPVQTTVDMEGVGVFRLGTWSLKDLSFGKMSRRNHTWYWTKYKQPHFHVTCEIRCRSKSVKRLLISTEHLWKSSRRHSQTTREMSQRIAETNFKWDNDNTKFVKSSTLLQVTEASYSAALDCATKCHPLETWAAARSHRTGKNESTPT